MGRSILALTFPKNTMGKWIVAKNEINARPSPIEKMS